MDILVCVDHSGSIMAAPLVPSRYTRSKTVLLCASNILIETYGPIILARRAQELRKSKGDPNIYAPMDLEKKGPKQMLTVTLLRPVSDRCS